MALHRDIFWIGRQWAVTGFGMQAINQKLGGEFDIAIERLWDDDLPELLREQKWFNAEDFAKGLVVARARYPQPSSKPAAPPLPVETLLQERKAPAVSEPAAPAVVPIVDAPAIVANEITPELPRPNPDPPAPSRMNLIGHTAKLLRVWRVRRRH